VAFLIASLRRGRLGLVELMPQPLSTRQGNLVLLVDQFEEIFRFHKHGDTNEASAFMNLLLASVEQQGVPIYTVITMRSDFLGDCSVFAGLPEAINEGQFLIPRLAREQCRAAILGPAAACGAEVEEQLVNRVLNDIGTDPDQLPLMQNVLMRVWTRIAGSHSLRERTQQASGDDAEPVMLTLDEYEAAGGLHAALSNHADELYQRLFDSDRHVAEVLFRCLSERGPISGIPVAPRR
jgi:hypothetical protein